MVPALPCGRHLRFQQEDFQFTTPDLAPGEHVIGLRGSDGGGNAGTSKAVVKIP